MGVCFSFKLAIAVVALIFKRLVAAVLDKINLLVAATVSAEIFAAVSVIFDTVIRPTALLLVALDEPISTGLRRVIVMPLGIGRGFVFLCLS